LDRMIESEDDMTDRFVGDIDPTEEAEGDGNRRKRGLT
jgi:hypothetical protein